MRNTVLAVAAGLCIGVAAPVLGLVAGNAARDTAPASQAAAQPAELDRTAVEGIVRNYLLDNPEILYDVQAALETKQQEAQKLAQGKVIGDHAEILFLSANDAVLGNPEGSVTIVEFFDYNCGYCRRALTDMEAMIEADPDLRFVLKEFPILGPDSQKAHVVSTAFRNLHPELYGEFHRRLLTGEGRADEARAMSLALELGADRDALLNAMKQPDVNERLAENYELANLLSITGTPSYVVGDEVVFGAIGHETLSGKIANFRECKSTSC